MKPAWKSWREVGGDELYEALKLRQDVFIIEQACIYPELDDIDQASQHLFARDDKGGLIGYLRVVPPGARYGEPSIGRLVVRKDARDKGLGRELMLEAVRKCDKLYHGQPVRIQAQKYLEGFYSSMGFRTVGEPYDEAGITHVEMLRAACEP